MRANVVAPGLIDTVMGRAASAGNAGRDRAVRAIPMRRQGTAWEVADAAVFLLRHRWERDGLAGQDGGRLMVVCGGERLGFVAYRRIGTSRSSYCWSIGIALLPSARGQGAGTQAQRLLARYLFAHTQVARVQAETDAANIAERRALERAGFTREGVLRNWNFRDGRWRDAVIYSILRGESR
ncbi:GNAT family N-acetyltransferase [Actinomadura xylanilytica]|uniref:GNAT family N-acetyltransferase n=1 Tax=Actinomadura xylanilytica TaxID=887459 RepID=UPI00255ADE30|nr:GNAT family N-acetyltransferase [Actinomadura xylanilytica]MDL4776628.1 GNAT family N-acetyltransferase [Actinomadura xylanilytica]